MEALYINTPLKTFSEILNCLIAHMARYYFVLGYPTERS